VDGTFHSSSFQTLARIDLLSRVERSLGCCRVSGKWSMINGRMCSIVCVCVVGDDYCAACACPLPLRRGVFGKHAVDISYLPLFLLVISTINDTIATDIVASKNNSLSRPWPLPGYPSYGPCYSEPPSNLRLCQETLAVAGRCTQHLAGVRMLLWQSDTDRPTSRRHT